MDKVAQLIVDQNARIEARKRDLTDAATVFARLCEQSPDVGLKQTALLELHTKGKAYFSCVESCIVEGCVSGAFEHPAWVNDTASSAEKVLRGAITFYGHLRRHREKLGLTPGSFEPTGNIFENMQSMLALSRPEVARMISQEFAAANLPGTHFEIPLKIKKMKNNPWVSGSFYLFASVVLIVTLAAVAKVVTPWILPPLIVGGMILITAVGAFQLRNDSKLAEKNFLVLMKHAFQMLPLVRNVFAKKRPE